MNEMDLLNSEVTLVSTRVVDKKFLKQQIQIEYFYDESPFGKFVAAFLDGEMCFLTFFDSHLGVCIRQLQDKFKNASLVYTKDYKFEPELKILLCGTSFEISVWKSLLKIKRGQTASYNDIATTIGHTNAVRAVGNAIGKNPISYIVPCHRVIRKNGQLGGFGSGPHRKLKMLNYEGVTLP